MIYGTSYFPSVKDAEHYYKPSGYDDVTAAVQRKIDRGEIHIGRPPLKPDEQCYLDHDERRYFIETGIFGEP